MTLSRRGSDPLLRAAVPLTRELAPVQAMELVRCLRNLAILRNEQVGGFISTPLVPGCPVGSSLSVMTSAGPTALWTCCCPDRAVE